MAQCLISWDSRVLPCSPRAAQTLLDTEPSKKEEKRKAVEVQALINKWKNKYSDETRTWPSREQQNFLLQPIKFSSECCGCFKVHNKEALQKWPSWFSSPDKAATVPIYKLSNSTETSLQTSAELLYGHNQRKTWTVTQSTQVCVAEFRFLMDWFKHFTFFVHMSSWWRAAALGSNPICRWTPRPQKGLHPPVHPFGRCKGAYRTRPVPLGTSTHK